MKRGFTLIELMVVISIISLLSSIIYSTLNAPRAEARDANRRQQVRQFETATQMYISDEGHAPDLQGTCGSSSTLGMSDCVAYSTADPSDPSKKKQKDAWDKYVQDISPYIPTIPDDPCGLTGCASGSGGQTGYVYIAPAVMDDICGASCAWGGDGFDNTYQLYALLENSNTPQGYSSSGSYYTAVIVPPPAPVTTFTYHGRAYAHGTPSPLGTYAEVDWETTNADTCTGVKREQGVDSDLGFQPTSGYVWLANDGHFEFIGIPVTLILTCTGPGGTSVASQTAGDEGWFPVITSFYADPPSVSVGGGTTLHWSASPADNCWLWNSTGTIDTGFTLPPAGFYSVSNILSTTEYYLRCKGGFSVSLQKTINVIVQ